MFEYLLDIISSTYSRGEISENHTIYSLTSNENNTQADNDRQIDDK